MCFEIVLKIQLTFFILMAWLEMSKTPRLFCKRSNGAGHLSRFFCRNKTIVNSKLTLLQNFLLGADNTDNTCNKFATQHVYYHLSTPFSCLSFLHFFQFSFAVLRSLHLSRLNLFNYSFLEIKVKWGDIKLNKSNRIGRN